MACGFLDFYARIFKSMNIKSQENKK